MNSNQHCEIEERKKRENREKQFVAISSVVAAVLLVSGKLGVGLWTNSLGILSEALHSGLDLVAAAVTLIAVKTSSKPADKDHTYGHGKIENLSALFETVLLLTTCVWIVYEATQRLLSVEHTPVNANLWAFVVIIVSIIVDISRSRALSRVAKKYDSQALEADALHFSTDIWSSAVVLVGLICTRIAEPLGLPWLHNADPIAAIGVAIIIVIVSYKLGRAAINSLLDSVPPEITASVRTAAEGVEGVSAVHQVRVRKAGPDYFADITLTTTPTASLEQAHETTDKIEASVKNILNNADVVVHVEPEPYTEVDLFYVSRRIANKFGILAHDITMRHSNDQKVLEMHVELPSDMRVDEAHDRVNSFEQALLSERSEYDRVVTHIEPIERTASAVTVDSSDVRAAIEQLAKLAGGNWSPDHIEVCSEGSNVSITFTCLVDASLSVGEAHTQTETIEQALRQRIPNVGRVAIHFEPRR